MSDRGRFVATVGGLPIFSNRQGSTDYLLCGPDGLEGWWDAPDIRLEQVNIPNGHGQFDLPSFLGSRVISISGHAFASTRGGLRMLGSQVKVLLQRDTVEVLVEEDGFTGIVAYGKPADVKWREYPNDTCAEFHIQVWCPDPLKYGQRNQFSMASDGAYIDIYHRGDFTAYPKVTITGSAADGYELAHPSGAVYQVDKPLVTGHPHEVDMRTGLLRVDGVVDMVGVTGASVWHVPPGAYHQMKVRPLTVGQTATAVCYVTDTYA